MKAKKQLTSIEWLEHRFDKYTSGGVQVPNDKIYKLTAKAKKVAEENKNYLIVWAGSWPGFRKVDSLSKLTRAEREFLEDDMAMLFSANEGRIFEIGLNGHKK